MTSIDILIADINRCIQLPPNQIPLALSKILSLDPNTNHHRAVSLSQDNPRPCTGFFNDEFTAFNNVVTLFVRLWCLMNPWSVLESFDLYGQLLNDQAQAFSNGQRGHLMTITIKETIDTVLPMATRLDISLKQRESTPWPRLTYMASVLLRVFNNIRTNDPTDQKKQIILFIGNRLCLIYNRIGSPLLCRNIYSNMNNLGLNWKRYLKNEQLQYRYYLARFYLIKHQLVDSYQHFLWCLVNCPLGFKDLTNVTSILKYLIPIAIIIGKCPNINYFSQTFYSSPQSIPPFIRTYQAIVQAIKRANFTEFHQCLELNYLQLKQSNILLLLANKCHILISRNLLRKTWLYLGQPNKLEFSQIKRAFALSINNSNAGHIGYNTYLTQLDNSGIHNLMTSLIDEDLVRGKIFPMLETVALSRSVVFPKVDFVNFTKFGNGIEGTLNSTDKWMN
ncbi:uncharacterized protein KQ657_005260 [Scheffersomyces spartinae]|uniref:PCI domain-containing protein n=1 Tax=Scheffersomyces spartinae TaxID=45513 RepID=A0A9P8AJE1_9ASCO|nr:uncharacterized protein KQ657_005260 [Scheffersomyces spartinae]KAG7194057.1 hypothetical protein KQ657_005260 [Scheffersomyces spartinae]